MTDKIQEDQLPIIIELAKKSDIDEIVEIENRSYLHPWSRSVLLAEIDGEEFSYVYVSRLQQHARIIGYIFFWVVSEEVHILNITVDPAYRGNGYAKQMMQFALDFGQEHGAKSALLEVRVSNTAARQLYVSLGFHQVGIRKKYYAKDREDAYVMKKLITTETKNS